MKARPVGFGPYRTFRIAEGRGVVRRIDTLKEPNSCLDAAVAEGDRLVQTKSTVGFSAPHPLDTQRSIGTEADIERAFAARVPGEELRRVEDRLRLRRGARQEAGEATAEQQRDRSTERVMERAMVLRRDAQHQTITTS